MNTVTNRMQYDSDFDSIAGTAMDAAESPEAATKATAAVLAADTASGRPTVDDPLDTSVTLAQGILRDGEWLRQAEVRELNGLDEEALARTGTNWPKFLSTLISRGTVSVGNEPLTPKLAGELLIGDREILILAIRRVTFGNDIEISEYPCPHCEELVELTIHLDSIPMKELEPSETGEYEVPLRKGGTAFVRLPTGADQEAALGKTSDNFVEQNTEILTRCVRRVTSNAGVQSAGRDLALSLGMADRAKITKFISDSQPGPRYTDVAFTHETCGREVPLPLTMAHLFRGV